MVLRSPCILKKARIHKMPTAVTEVISLWVIKFLPWRERPQERTDIFLHMEMRFSQRFRLRCVYTNYAKQTCHSRLHAPPRGEFYNRQPFKLRNYVITDGVLFDPAGCLEIWISPGYIYFTRCKRSAALMVMSWRAAFNDTRANYMRMQAEGK